MKLVIEIGETSDAMGVVSQCVILPSLDEEKFGISLNNFSQANQVARLTEVAQEVEKAVSSYYSKECFPRVRKHNSNETPLSGGLILASAEPLNQRTQHDRSSDNE